MKEFRVPPVWILNEGTVPPGYILSRGTVLLECILNGGTVPLGCIANGGTVPPVYVFLIYNQLTTCFWGYILKTKIIYLCEMLTFQHSKNKLKLFCHIVPGLINGLYQLPTKRGHNDQFRVYSSVSLLTSLSLDLHMGYSYQDLWKIDKAIYINLY